MAITAAGRSLLRRPALEERLDETFGGRLTLVVAGAGYGKSTLVAQWAEELESAWHTVSAGDRRLSTLASGLTKALRPWLGTLPEEFHAALAGGRGELAQAEVVAGQLSEVLGSELAHDLVLVVDDAHELASSPAALRLIESLCRQAPATVHVVVLAREALDLRVDRLRVQGLLLELNSKDLLFSSSEIHELSQSLVTANDEVAAQIEALTGGWPAAVRLALEALAGVPEERLPTALERSSRPGTPLFTYLAHEVFERESPEVQELIRTVAPLDRFTPALCDALGIARARDAIAGLVQRGLFVQRHGDEFELHALAREFARSAWPLGDEAERLVHKRAAEWLESETRIVEALRAFAAAAEVDRVLFLLAGHGEALLGSGDAQTVIDVAGGLPAASRTAKIEQLLGDALVVRGLFEPAIETYERAVSKAGAMGPGLAWRLGVAHHFRGSYDQAVATYEQALDRVGETSDDAILLGWVASAYWLRGDLERARPLASRALEIADRTGDDRALAAACVAAEGVYAPELHHRDEQLLDEALAAAKRCGDLVLLRRIRVNRTAALVDRGMYGQALAEVNEALALSEISGIGFPDRAVTNRARIFLRLGLLDEAHTDYSAVLELSRANGTIEFRYGHLGLGDVQRERGNVALARTEYERSLRLTEGGDEIYGYLMSLQGLARLLVDEDPGRARELAAKAAAVQPWYYRAWALNSAAWVALALGDRHDAAAAAAEAAVVARARDDVFALAESLELETFTRDEPAADTSALEEARTIWEELESRVRLAACELALAHLGSGPGAIAAQGRALAALRALGVRAEPAGPAGLLRMIAAAPPEPLVVQVLGGFRVLRHGVPVATSSWQSKRARDLLKILVSRRGRPVPRDVLMEALWPGEDVEKLSNRLSVSLSTLRSVLDPDGKFAPEHFVKTDRASVALDLTSVVVDVEVFLHEAATGMALRGDGQAAAAREWLTQAESAYAGDALEDDPYADWAVSLREEALATYGSVAHALAEDAAAAGEDESAQRYLLRILGHDPYDERAHISLVSVLERLGRRGRARQAYRTYVTRMEEIGATPAAFPDAGLKTS